MAEEMAWEATPVYTSCHRDNGGSNLCSFPGKNSKVCAYHLKTKEGTSSRGSMPSFVGTNLVHPILSIGWRACHLWLSLKPVPWPSRASLEVEPRVSQGPALLPALLLAASHGFSPLPKHIDLSQLIARLSCHSTGPRTLVCPCDPHSDCFAQIRVELPTCEVVITQSLRL